MLQFINVEPTLDTLFTTGWISSIVLHHIISFFNVKSINNKCPVNVVEYKVATVLLFEM